MIVYDIDECFGCGGDIDANGHYLYAKVERRGDGHPKSSWLQCAFCGRPITAEEVEEAVLNHHASQQPIMVCVPEDWTPKQIRAFQRLLDREHAEYPKTGLPLCYVQRVLRHSDVRSTLNYVGGMNNVIRIWSKKRHVDAVPLRRERN